MVVRRRIAEELTDRGRTSEASEWSRRTMEEACGRPDVLYSLAVIYARKAGLVGAYSTRLDAHRLRQRRGRLGDAIEMLRRAVGDGFKDAARLRGDAAFLPIRSDPGFAAILGDLEFPTDPFTAR